MSTHVKIVNTDSYILNFAYRITTQNISPDHAVASQTTKPPTTQAKISLELHWCG